MSNQAQATPQKASTSPIMLPLNKLIADPDNVRLTRSDNGIEALADNIHAEGLLQNLIVRKVKGGKYAVTGGERRRTALNVLVKRKQMKATDQIPCKLIDDSHNGLCNPAVIENIRMETVDEKKILILELI